MPFRFYGLAHANEATLRFVDGVLRVLGVAKATNLGGRNASRLQAMANMMWGHANSLRAYKGCIAMACLRDDSRGPSFSKYVWCYGVSSPTLHAEEHMLLETTGGVIPANGIEMLIKAAFILLEPCVPGQYGRKNCRALFADHGSRGGRVRGTYNMQDVDVAAAIRPDDLANHVQNIPVFYIYPYTGDSQSLGCWTAIPDSIYTQMDPQCISSTFQDPQ
jgi:hypothetical protein